MSDTQSTMPVTKIEEESDSGDSDVADSVPGNASSMSSIQYSQPGTGMYYSTHSTHSQAQVCTVHTVTSTHNQVQVCTTVH